MDLFLLDTAESWSAEVQSVDADDAATAAGASAMHLAGGDGMSDSQRELVDIMQQVKSNTLTMQEAEFFFCDWKARHERGFSRSFKQKQVCHLSRPP